MKVFTRALPLVSLAAFALLSLYPLWLSGKFKRSYAGALTPKRAEPDASSPRCAAQKKTATLSPDATETCTYKFTSGTGITYLQFCVSVNGNIVEFQNPSGVEQFSPNGSAPYEGYGICDITNSDTQYYDYAYTDSGNWNASTKVTSTATSVKIERTTSDGAWTLTQTITSARAPTPTPRLPWLSRTIRLSPKTPYSCALATPFPIAVPHTRRTTTDPRTPHGVTSRLPTILVPMVWSFRGNATPPTAW